MPDILFNLLSFLAIISIIVFVHEFGHYYVAISSGVKVEVFSIGMGPEIIGWNDKRGTRWKICLLPIGGYVKMFGDSNAASVGDNEMLANMSEDEKKIAFHHKSLLQKSSIVAAGPIANFLLAIVMLFMLYLGYGKAYTSNEITQIEQHSVAAKAGLEIGDIITKIDNKEIHSFEDIKAIIITSKDKNLNFLVNRNGTEYDIKITPELKERNDAFGNKVMLPSIGVASNKILHRKIGIFSSLHIAIKDTYKISVMTLESIGQMITGKISTDNIGGAIKIAQYSGESVKQGFSNVLWFIAILSINLGLFNLFPIPVLDGGHLFFYLIEAIRGKPMGMSAQKFSFRLGFLVIGSLLIFSFMNDIKSLF